MKKALFLILTTIAITQLAPANPDTTKELRFKYKKGDNYRILSTVSENVKVNGRFDHHAEIINRVSVRVTDTKGKSGFNEATFMTSEDSTGMAGSKFAWGDEYESKFWRDEKGVYDISDEYFMPVVRDVPVFPDYPVKIGDTWTVEGHEAHDLRRQFNIKKPFKVPFIAKYKYEKDDGDLKVISVQYTLYSENPVPQNAETLQDFITSTMGYSRQTIWWDNEKGQIDHYIETFRITMDTAGGLTFDFTGTAQAEVTEFERSATEEKIAEVQKEIEKMGLENVGVEKTEKGLKLTIENIQFEPDSAILVKTEQEKLKLISEILTAYENDLLISGHTALAGSPESCQALSEERAASVADYLIKLGVRDKYHIFTQGFGARIPIASNRTEAGKAKNRRVEITILDK